MNFENISEYLDVFDKLDEKSAKMVLNASNFDLATKKSILHSSNKFSDKADDIFKSLDFSKNIADITKSIDKLDDIGDVSKLLNFKGLSKDTVKAALASSKFADSADDILDKLDSVDDILDSSTDIIGEKLKDIKNGFKGLATSIAAHPIITGITAITAAGVAAYSIYKNYKKNMMETATASSHHGFQVWPQLLHLLTVLLLPKNPVQNEYPFCPAVIEVDPHFGQRGLDSSAFLRSASAS